MPDEIVFETEISPDEPAQDPNAVQLSQNEGVTE